MFFEVFFNFLKNYFQPGQVNIANSRLVGFIRIDDQEGPRGYVRQRAYLSHVGTSKGEY